MILYHGSNAIVEYPEIRKAKYNKDFYFGFYCTRYQEQAERWATRYGKKRYVNQYEYEPNEKLNYLLFEEMTEEWLDFIVACRQGKSHKYDIVEGPMADDTIYNYIQNFIDGKISRAAFWELVKFKYPTHQISFHTISALDTLKFCPKEAARKVEKLLLSAIANWSVKNEGQRVDDAALYIKEIFVDGAGILKRLRPASQERAHRIRKRSNHVTIVLGSKTAVVENTVKE